MDNDQSAEVEGQEPEVEPDQGGEFDPERALATIRKQRAEEKRLKEQLAEARAAQEELQALKQAEADKQKSLEEKLAERDAEIQALKASIASGRTKEDFARQAVERGYDPGQVELAYLAAKEQGLLGKYDPKTGEVGKHDFETLEEKYPALQGEPLGFTGDAGRRPTGGQARTVNSAFNSVVRQSMRR